MAITLNGPLVLVGAGKMGGAMLAGWLEQGLDPDLVYIQEPSPPPEVLDLLRAFNITTHTALPANMPAPAVLLVAVKPQVMEQVFPPLVARVGPDTVVLSIAAGRTIKSFEAHLKPGTAVVRSIPNTPAAIARGITVCCPNKHVKTAQRQLCDDLLSAVGDVGWVDDESLIDVATAVSGSGPAYVFLLAETLAEAGRKAGLDATLARQLADATVAGSGELLRRSGLDPAVLRQNVTSPNGTTHAALQLLMADPGGLQPLMTAAIAAATKRSRELSS
jgi:pyrroline-5-carboxylate reductase